MYHPADASGRQDPAVPGWLARDLGIDPATPAPLVSTRARRARRFRHANANADLAAVPVLEGLSAKQLRLVAQLTTPVPVPAATTLAEEGAPGLEFFFVVDGEVEVIQGTAIVARRGRGAHVGEASLLTNRPRNATLVTATPAEVRVASAQEFRSLLRAIPQFEERLLASMAERAA